MDEHFLIFSYETHFFLKFLDLWVSNYIYFLKNLRPLFIESSLANSSSCVDGPLQENAAPSGSIFNRSKARPMERGQRSYFKIQEKAFGVLNKISVFQIFITGGDLGKCAG